MQQAVFSSLESHRRKEQEEAGVTTYKLKRSRAGARTTVLWLPVSGSLKVATLTLWELQAEAKWKPPRPDTEKQLEPYCFGVVDLRTGLLRPQYEVVWQSTACVASSRSGACLPPFENDIQPVYRQKYLPWLVRQRQILQRSANDVLYWRQQSDCSWNEPICLPRPDSRAAPSPKSSSGS